MHREWDNRVRRITGGLTIHTPARGQWVGNGGQLFSERMIPVRIACGPDEIERIVEITAEFYDQHAVMVYCVSDDVRIYHREK
jgi:hypothetical protein